MDSFAESIVRDLAEAETRVNQTPAYCLLCQAGLWGTRGPDDHFDFCPKGRAIQWVTENPGENDG